MIFFSRNHVGVSVGAFNRPDLESFGANGRDDGQTVSLLHFIRIADGYGSMNFIIYTL